MGKKIMIDEKLNQSEMLQLLDDATSLEDALSVHGWIHEQSRYEVSTLSEVAEFFEVEEQTARAWRLMTPPMPGTKGRWPIDRIAQWRVARLEQSDTSAAKRKQDYDIGEIKLEDKQLELDRLKASVVRRDDVEEWVSAALDTVRGIMGLPTTLAASISGSADFVRTESDRHCRDLLTGVERRLQLSEIGKHDERNQNG
jgi:hypothetical protein